MAAAPTVADVEAAFTITSSASPLDDRVHVRELRLLLTNMRIAATQSKYLAAIGQVPAVVHMSADTEIASWVTVPSDALQADVNTAVNSLKAIAAVHAASVGTAATDGFHKAADGTAATTLAAIPAATNLATCITLITGLMAWLKAHGIQSGTHFSNDSTLAALALTVAPPVTLANCITDANDLAGFFAGHFAHAIS